MTELEKWKRLLKHFIFSYYANSTLEKLLVIKTAIHLNLLDILQRALQSQFQ
ncbi:hypothetical protein Mal35_18650 [Gimesia maris]|nr:hypothetical protein Mal35_18650 [Gimesia maris]